MQKLNINQWAEEDRPREKLMRLGAEALSSAELLAILIGSGSTHESAVDLMKSILNKCNNNLNSLGKMSISQLCEFNGIGEAKALTIIAAAEIGKRRMMEDSHKIQQIRTSADVLHYMNPYIQDLNHEECWVLLLNNYARLINCVRISQGGLTETAVDVRVVLKEALKHDATSFILVHNHPSGNMRPSRYDDDLTQRMSRAAATVNLRMIDHVIVTEGEYYSYSENGKI